MRGWSSLTVNFKWLYGEYAKCQDVQTIKSFIFDELELIKSIQPNKKVVFILDSLDQLTPNDYKNVDKWFPVELPSNLKFFVSTLPEHGNLLNMIERIIAKKRANDLNGNTTDDGDSLKKKLVLKIEVLDPSQCELILGEWLITAHRKLTDSQWADLKEVFRKGTLLPLFLKLIYDVVIHSHSFDKLNENFLKCVKIDDIILYMFKHFEKVHGSVIFRRAICYMTVCKNGISNNELEDILSLGK